jgi:hypothetical protein
MVDTKLYGNDPHVFLIKDRNYATHEEAVMKSEQRFWAEFWSTTLNFLD